MSDAVINVGGDNIYVNVSGGEGPSLYDLWIQQGNTGTLNDFFNAMVATLDLTVTGAAGQSVTSRALLAAIAGPVAGQTAYLAEAGREGWFIFTDDDKSAEVTADTTQAIYVAPSTDTTGASGAWVRVYYDQLDVGWFGATGDGSTDDTAAIQAAIDWAADQGVAKLFFPEGIYQVTKLTVPAIDTGPIQVIELVGVAQPSTMFGTIGTVTLSDDGSIIRSAAIGDAIIRVLPTAYPFSNVHVVLRNLNFRSYDNPNIDAVDAGYAQQLTCENLVIDTGAYAVQASEPTNGGRGLITPLNNNGAWTKLMGLSISGYDHAIDVNEHTFIDYVAITACKQAFALEEANHSSKIIRAGVYRCTYGVYVNGGCDVDFDSISFEHLNTGSPVGAGAEYHTAGNAWQETIADIYDPTSLGRGRVNWAVTLGFVGRDDDGFIIDGGRGFLQTRVGTNAMKIGQFGRGANQSIPNNALTPISFTTEFGDCCVINSGDATEIEVEEDGVYEVRFQAAFAANATGQRQLQIVKGGVGETAYAIENSPNLGAGITYISITLPAIGATAGEYFKVTAFQDSGGALNLLSAAYSCILTVKKLRGRPLA